MRIAYLAFALALALNGCSSGPGDAMPEIPEIAIEELPDSVRAEAQSLIDDLAANPTDPWANGDLARVLHAQNRLPEAQGLYRRAASLSGGEFRWIYLLGVAQQENKQYGQAASSFREALNTRPYGPGWIRLGESLAAERQFEAAADALRSAAGLEGNDAYVSYTLGKVLLELGQTAEALELLERAVVLAPDSGGARHLLGTAYLAAGEEDLAQRAFPKAGSDTTAEPTLDDALYASVAALAENASHFLNLGRSLDAEGRTAEAIEAYQRAIELDPGMAQAHANLVGSFGRTGEIDQAEAHYAKAIALNPNLAELHNNWGVVQASQGDSAAATAAFRRALESDPNSARANANLGVALFEAGNREEAARRFRDAIKSDPTNRPARMNLGTLALEDDRPGEAVEHLEAALEGDEDGSEAFVRYALGHAYYSSGRVTDALQSFEEALRVAEESGPADLANQIRVDLESLPQ